MLDTLIVAVVLCVDTCGQSPSQVRMQGVFREVGIVGHVIGSVHLMQAEDRREGKPYWHLKDTYIMRPNELSKNQNIGKYNSNKHKDGNKIK